VKNLETYIGTHAVTQLENKTEIKQHECAERYLYSNHKHFFRRKTVKKCLPGTGLIKAELSTYWASGLKFYMGPFYKTCFIKLLATLAERYIF
jgi:hypothetical protein